MSKYGVFSGPYSVRIRENTDQKKSVFGRFSHNEYLLKIFSAHVVHDDDKKIVKKSNRENLRKIYVKRPSWR